MAEIRIRVLIIDELILYCHIFNAIRFILW